MRWIHINHVGIGHASLDGAFEGTARIGADILGEHQHHNAVAHFFHMLIRKSILNSSRLFQRQEFAVVTDQGDGVVGDLLAHSQVFGFADDFGKGVYIHESGLV